MRQIAFLTAFLATATILPAADPALLNLVMPDAKVVAGVNVQKTENSQFGQYLLRSISTDAGLQQFIAASGFDPTKDITELVFATDATSKTGLAIASGKFDAPKLVAAATAIHGQFTSLSYNGAVLLTSVAPGGMAMGLYPEGSAATLALVGDQESVKAALNRRLLTNPLNPQLAAKIAVYGSSDAWTVSIAPVSTIAGAGSKNPLSSGMGADLLKKVQQTSGGITFGSPVQIVGEAVANSPRMPPH